MTLDLDNVHFTGTEGSGQQQKCWINVSGKNYLIKINSKYREASKEVSAYNIGKACGLPVVEYKEEKYTYEGRTRIGCICESYLLPNEESKAVWWMLNDIQIPKGTPATAYFNVITNELSKLSGISLADAQAYIMNLVTFDYLVCNPDRHLGNIEVIHNVLTNTWRLPPMYDFGQSFFKRDGVSSTAELQHWDRSFKTLPFSRNPERNLIDIQTAKNICIGYLENIKRTCGEIDNITAKDFHLRVFKMRVQKLLGL